MAAEAGAEFAVGATDHDLRTLLLDTVDRKPKEHDFRENYQPGRRMIAIGG